MRFAEMGYSLPFHAPLYSSRIGQRILWLKVISVACRAAPEVLVRYVPHPLRLRDDCVKVIVTQHCPRGQSMPAFGGGIYLHASFRDTVGNYPIVTFSDSDKVVCADREELGGPALICDRGTLVEQEASVSGVVRRHDQVIFAASVSLDDRQEGRCLVWGEDEPLFHYKKIPNGDFRGRPLREIVSIRVNPGEIVRSSSGEGSVRLGTTIWNLHQFAPLEITGASFVHFEGGCLESAEVLWEE